MTDDPHAPPHHALHGLFYGLGAYGLWGLIPLYFKALRHVAPLEVLAHRAAWSFLLLGAVAVVGGQWRTVAAIVRNRRTAAMLALSTVAIAVNWLTFIYAVGQRQVLQSSLGYFITPLVNVFLGVAILGEVLRPLQKAAMSLALAGVLVLTLAVGQVPWIALTLAVSFSLYGLLRKVMPVGGFVGLTIETLALTPAAVAYLAFLQVDGTATAADGATWAVLAASGAVTSAPLLLFVGAARRLRLSTLGVLQYLSPTMQFLLAVLAFGEPFTAPQVATFLCIWTAVALYAADGLRAAASKCGDVIEPD